MTPRLAVLALLSLLVRSAFPAADDRPAFKVVVNVAFAGEAVKRAAVADVFLKKVSRWPDGVAVAPVDQSLTSKLRASFSERVLHRPAAAVHQYWQRQIFSGREQPPPVKLSDAEVIAYVQAHPGGVGYVAEGTPLVAGVKEVKLE
jgi:hypothetical protein